MRQNTGPAGFPRQDDVTVSFNGDPRAQFASSAPAAPEGVTAFNAQHPSVTIYTAAVDRQLNDQKYILPGLGDFGDRLYGT